MWHTTPLVLYTPAGLAAMRKKKGLKSIPVRTVVYRLKAGLLSPDVVIYGPKGRPVAFGIDLARSDEVFLPRG